MKTPEVESRLYRVIDEFEQQRQSIEAGARKIDDFEWQIGLLREFVDVGECGLAFESVICWCEMFPITLTGPAAVALVELALHFGYKTTRNEDAKYDLTKYWLGGCTSNVFNEAVPQDRPQTGA